MLSATALIVVAGVRLLKNPCFRNCFTSILALTGGAACDCVPSWLLEYVCFKTNAFPFALSTFWLSLRKCGCWSAFASKSIRFYRFYKHVGSHSRCCLRLRSSWLLGCVCFEINTLSLVSQSFWPLLEVLPATTFIVVAAVRLLQNQRLSFGFIIILALCRGAACDCVHRGC